MYVTLRSTAPEVINAVHIFPIKASCLGPAERELYSPGFLLMHGVCAVFKLFGLIV